MIGYVIVAVVAFVAGSITERVISAPLHKALNSLEGEVSRAHAAAQHLEKTIVDAVSKARKKL